MRDRTCRNVISVCNIKGGSAKTTTTVNLGFALAEEGMRTLIIDLDHQGNATTALMGLDYRPGFSTYEYLAGLVNGRRIIFDDVAIQRTEKLVLIPAKEALKKIEGDLTVATRQNPKSDVRKYMLKRIFEIDESFDYIMLDCPAGGHYVPQNALVASDYVIIPGDDTQSIDEAVKLKDIIDYDIRDVNPTIKILGFLVTKYTGRFIKDKNFEHRLKTKIKDRIFKTRIRQDTKIQEAYDRGLSILEYRRWSNAGQDYVNLAKEVIDLTNKIPGDNEHDGRESQGRREYYGD